MKQLKFRSLLWTSGLSPEKYHKAQESNADISIIDFEDSVPPKLKKTAKKLSVSYLKSSTNILKGVRINGLGEKYGLEDLLFLIENNISLDLVVIPKVNSPEEIILVEKIISSMEVPIKLCATIETLIGLSNVEKIASASKNLVAIIFGAADFSSDLGIEMSWEGLLHARSKMIYAAAMAGILALDAPCFDLNNLDALKKQSMASKTLGFSGMAALHPRQVSMINDVYTPSIKEITWAKKVIESTRKTKNNICLVDNSMVGPPFISRAKRILDYAALI